MKAVLLQWNDAQSVDGWETISELLKRELAKVFTVGWLVGETKEAYVVANTIHSIDADEPDAACTMSVPKGMVKRMRTLGTLTDRGTFTKT